MELAIIVMFNMEVLIIYHEHCVDESYRDWIEEHYLPIPPNSKDSIGN